MPYDNRHCWLKRRSRPYRSHPMLYGCGCGVVDNPNCLTTSTKMRFFWLLLSKIKCSGVSFTHICEWKRHSPSSGSVGSSGWIVAVTKIAVGPASMIYPLPVFSGSDSESGSAPCIWSRPPMTVLRDIHRCCSRGFCGNHTIFRCPSLSSHDPSFPMA